LPACAPSGLLLGRSMARPHLKWPSLFVAVIAAAVVGGLASAGDNRCAEDLTCVTACTAATTPSANGSFASRLTCGGASCDAHFSRCMCPAGSALRLNGACEEASFPADERICEPEHNVLLTAVLWSSPDVGPHDVSNGLVPPALLTILQLATSAALGVGTERVALTDVKMTSRRSGASSWNASTVGLLVFDLSLSFCAAPGIQFSIDPRGFERSILLLSQEFAAFHMGTIRLLNLRDHCAAMSEATWGAALTEGLGMPNSTSGLFQQQAASDSDSGGSRSNSTWKALACSVWVLLGLSLCLAIVVRTCLFCRKKIGAKGDVAVDLEAPAGLTPVERMSGQEQPSLEVSPRLGSPRGGHRNAAGAMVSAKSAFDPAESEHIPEFEGRYLALRMGDILEVVCDSTSGWLYGFHVGRSEQLGYFPENRVSWIGRPLRQGPFGTATSCPSGVPEGNANGDIVLESARSPSSQRTGVVTSTRGSLRRAPFSAGASCSLGVPEGVGVEGDIGVESARLHGSRRTQIEGDLVIESARSHVSE